MIATVLLVLVLLILIYRSPLLAIIPLIVVGLAYGVISPTLGFFAEQGWIDKDSQAVSIMTVLLFGAGTDYCLFLISKYREILLDVEDKATAMKLAVKESGGAIMMSALTVVIGLATLSLAHYGSFQRFAVPFSFGVLVMGIAALVVLPAILVIIGRVAFFPFTPRTEEMAKAKGKKQHKPSHKVSHKIGHFVTHKPWIVIAVTVLLLGGLAAFVPRIQYTFDLLSSFPEDMPSREGFTLIEENFSPGELAPVQLVIDTQGSDVNLQQQLTKIPYIDNVSDVQIGTKNNSIQLYELSLPKIPIAAPRFSFGNSMTFINNGDILAAPAACTIRPASNMPKFGAKPAIIVPIVKIDIAVINKCLFLKRVTKNADAGTKIPLTSIYPVASHCTFAYVIPKSFMIVGNATFNNVLLRKATKAPTNKIAIMP
ncbi:hypothetical protein LSPH24S_02125 [Lysinibacillus sphaericus]